MTLVERLVERLGGIVEWQIGSKGIMPRWAVTYRDEAKRESLITVWLANGLVAYCFVDDLAFVGHDCPKLEPLIMES